MLSDKEIKKQFREKAGKEPERYYTTGVLKAEGFSRKQCRQCRRYFWSTEGRDCCGDPGCGNGYEFIGKSPAKEPLSYIEVWKRFAKLFKSWGYTPIKRYPVVARWRNDTDWVGASIYDFQPYVVSGEVEPPANPLVVPQFCLRFNDIDNVGLTGAHHTGFVMIGQHAFCKPEDWNQERYFTDIHNWLKKGLGLKNEHIIFHEDAWAGGGNFGPCMEFFSKGIELGNQVYMLYEQNPAGYKELNLKVLDMGMGHERNAWFSQGTPTIYDAVFPPVIKKLAKAAGIKIDRELQERFVPLAGCLNADEADDIAKAWGIIAKKIGIDVQELKKKMQELAAFYSIAEHSRSLLVAISDGALPSNVSGMYNLRVILRRALGFIDQYGWKVNLPDVCEWHAAYLKPLFPELRENLENVRKILELEKEKYKSTKQKARQVIGRIVEKQICQEELIKMYDEQGIAPAAIKEEAAKVGKEVSVPDNFYALVTARHEKRVQAPAEKNEIAVSGLPDTEALYFEDYKKIEASAMVLRIVGNNVILDKTVFYPTGGGQAHDTGKIKGINVVDVYRQGGIIAHLLAVKPDFSEGDAVDEKVDFERRKQLTQHHTATHIVNAAARIVLGQHVNQAGAKKETDRAHLDITHYQLISEEEKRVIEREANRIVSENIPLNLAFFPRSQAEKMFGMRIYQGGAVPGKAIRIVEIPGIDVEACAGTHLHTTAEAEKIAILNTSKVQDGIIRITFAAGNAARQTESREHSIVLEAAGILGVKPAQLPARARELFEKWKLARKAVKKGKKMLAVELELKSTGESSGNLLAETAGVLSTQPEHVVNTIKRFLGDIDEFRKKIVEN